MKTTGTRRFLSLLLALVLALGGVALAPIPAKATGTTWEVSKNPTSGNNIHWVDLGNGGSVWGGIQSDDTLNITQAPSGAAGIVIPASITGLTIDGGNLTLTDVSIGAWDNIALTLKNIKIDTSVDAALFFNGSGNSSLTAQGTVTLTSTNTSNHGIYCNGDLTVSGTVTATGDTGGITCGGDLTVGGSVTATGGTNGIYCNGALTVNGKVAATGGGNGIGCGGDLTVSGSVTATATSLSTGISYAGALTVNGSGSVSAKNAGSITGIHTFQTTDSGGSWSVTPASALQSGSLTGIGNIDVDITDTDYTTVKRVPAATPPDNGNRVSGTETDDTGWVTGERTDTMKAGIALSGGGTFRGQRGGVSFTAEGLTPAQLLRVLVDLEELDARDYDVRTGSTIVTLQESYLRTLTPGEYVLTLEFVAHTGETIFTVEAAQPQQAEPIPSDNYNPNTGRSPKL